MNKQEIYEDLVRLRDEARYYMINEAESKSIEEARFIAIIYHLQEALKVIIGTPP